VSIKKKFVTAVTTAGLLAGLFGSAFVPTAYGAGRTPAAADQPKAKYTVVGDLDFDGDANLTDTNFGGDANKDDRDGLGSAITHDEDKDVYGFTSDASDVTVAEDNATISFTFYTDGAAGLGDTELTTADVKAVSSTSKIQVAWAYASADGAATTCEALDGATTLFAISDEINSAAGNAKGSYDLCLAAAEDDTAATGTIKVYAGLADTGEYVLMKTITVTAIGPLASLTMSITDGYKYVANENSELAGWLSVIGKDANGTVLNGATGTVSTTALAVTLTEYADNPENADGEAIDFFDDADGNSSTADADGGITEYALEEDTCNEGDGDEILGDEGKSYSLKIEDVTGDVVSNAIVITCTLDSSGAIVTKVTGEAASGAQVFDDGATGDDEFAFTGTVTDADGRPLGDGAVAVDFDWSFEFKVTNGLDEEWDDLGAVAALGGTIELGQLDNTDGAGAANPDFGRLGRHTMSLTAANSDLGADAGDEVEKVFTVVYTATASDDTALTVTRNAAKRIATVKADMGEANSLERVEFTVELASGEIKVFVRRANADGVATLTLSRRNTTVYVWAAMEETGDGQTDIVKVRFR
jgi:hypothetical protein